MTDLIACLSASEKGRVHVQKLVDGKDWANIFLVTTPDSKSNFKCAKKVSYVIIDEKASASDIIKQIQSQLNGKLNDLEVALNLVCGTGKEHMALISALIKLGMGIRLMAVTKDGVCEI
jgi:hypothetical protein